MWFDAVYDGYYVRFSCDTTRVGMMVMSTDMTPKYGVGTVTIGLRGQAATSVLTDTDLIGEQGGGWLVPLGYFGTIEATVGRPGVDSFARTFEVTTNGTCGFVAVTAP